MLKLYPEKELIEEQSLREINVGTLYCQDYDSIIGQEEYSDFGYSSGSAFPSGEDFSRFSERVLNFYHNIKNSQEDCLLVSHSGVLNIILHHYYSIDFKQFPFFNIKNAYPYSLENK